MGQDVYNSEAERREWETWWATKLDKNDRFATELAVTGLKQSLLAHAAVAVIALNALLGSAPNRFSLLFTLFASLLGLCLSVTGQIMLFELITSFGNEVTGHLIRKRHSMRSMAATATFGHRYFTRPFKLAHFIVYGSIVWFIVYLFVGAILIAHDI